MEMFSMEYAKNGSRLLVHLGNLALSGSELSLFFSFFKKVIFCSLLYISTSLT